MNSTKTSLVVLFICAAFTTRASGQVGSERLAGGPLVGTKAGQVREDNDLAMKFVWCPPGDLTMEQIDVVEEPVAPGPEVKKKMRRVD